MHRLTWSRWHSRDQNPRWALLHCKVAWLQYLCAWQRGFIPKVDPLVVAAVAEMRVFYCKMVTRTCGEIQMWIEALDQLQGLEQYLWQLLVHPPSFIFTVIRLKSDVKPAARCQMTVCFQLSVLWQMTQLLIMLIQSHHFSKESRS